MWLLSGSTLRKFYHSNPNQFNFRYRAVRDLPPSVWRCNETPMEIRHLWSSVLFTWTFVQQWVCVLSSFSWRYPFQVINLKVPVTTLAARLLTFSSSSWRPTIHVHLKGPQQNIMKDHNIAVISEINFIFLSLMEVWTQWVTGKVSDAGRNFDLNLANKRRRKVIIRRVWLLRSRAFTMACYVGQSIIAFIYDVAYA